MFACTHDSGGAAAWVLLAFYCFGITGSTICDGCALE
jgi:hypothetical protein